ncbi:hypothetical protein GCM10009809_16980 [Isoptericola hypogeus]|uniref:Uncharacterized protein n=2 Tax=Isoptericola hypogeus TaxID=300179 RepID=A0ABN2JBK8_9MICO
MMAELEALDPARDLRAPGREDDDALAAILGTDRRSRRRVSRPALVASAAAAAVVAVAVGVTLTSTLGAPPAYATWTPVPAELTPAQAAERAEPCGTAAHEIVDGPDGSQVVEVPVDPVLTEVRGEYAYVILAGDGAVTQCFVTTPADGPQDVVTTDAVLPGAAAVPGPGEVTTLESGTASWSGSGSGDGALTSAFGRAGDDVAAIELTLDDGRAVQASVDDGWWAVWAPGDASLGTEAVVTRTDGTTAKVALDGS